MESYWFTGKESKHDFRIFSGCGKYHSIHRYYWIRDGRRWTGNFHLYSVKVCEAERQNTEKVGAKRICGDWRSINTYSFFVDLKYYHKFNLVSKSSILLKTLRLSKSMDSLFSSKIYRNNSFANFLKSICFIFIMYGKLLLVLSVHSFKRILRIWSMRICCADGKSEIPAWIIWAKKTPHPESMKSHNILKRFWFYYR